MILPDANRPREEIIARLLVAMHAANLTEESALYALIMTIVALLEHDRASIDSVFDKMSKLNSDLMKNFRSLENRVEMQMGEVKINLTNQNVVAQDRSRLEAKLDHVCSELLFIGQTLSSRTSGFASTTTEPAIGKEPSTPREIAIAALYRHK